MIHIYIYIYIYYNSVWQARVLAIHLLCTYLLGCILAQAHGQRHLLVSVLKPSVQMATPGLIGLASLVRALGSPVWLELWFHCREILARHVASRLDLAILVGV